MELLTLLFIMLVLFSSAIIGGHIIRWITRNEFDDVIRQRQNYNNIQEEI